MEAGVEALGREHDAAVGMAERDGDRVAATHQDAFDQGLAAVVVAGHAASLPVGCPRTRRPADLVVPARATPSPGAACIIVRMSGAGLRVVIAEDSVLLREGLVRLLEDAGATVVARVGDGPSLVAAVVEHRPDVSVVDVRMPPTQRDEGLRAAIEARRLVPGSPVLVLSQYVERQYASELLADRAGGVGYLLKDRVADVREFMDALAPGRGGRHGARPRGRRPAHGQPPARRPARGADPARAGGPGGDGGGPDQRRDRRRARHQRGRRGEAHHEHPRQARPPRQRERQPPGAGGARLPRPDGPGAPGGLAGRQRAGPRGRRSGRPPGSTTASVPSSACARSRSPASPPPAGRRPADAVVAHLDHQRPRSRRTATSQRVAELCLATFARASTTTK